MTEKPALSRGLVAILGFLAAVGPFATDMYLASFTNIAEDLGAGPPQVQLTLTAFFIGMGSGQLFLGPASDKFGRRRVLLAGLGVFAASSIAMVSSPTITIFVVLRLIQGFSGAAGVVVSRAIAVDLSTGTTAVRALSLIAMVVGLGPLVAPVTGGFIAGLTDWRGVLAALAIIATAMFALALVFVKESLPPQDRNTGSWWSVYSPIFTLLRIPAIVGYTVAFAFAFGAMMSYISASPFVAQILLDMNELQYALSFAAAASSMVIANMINSRVAPTIGPERMVLIGSLLQLAAAGSFVLMTTTQSLNILQFIVTAFVLSGGAGLVMSNSNALGVSFAPKQNRGSASAIMGTTQFAIAGLLSPLVGLWGEDTAWPMTVVVLLASVVALVAILLSRAKTA